MFATPVGNPVLIPPPVDSPHQKSILLSTKQQF